ncbi:hypothetical protein SUDANB5_03660 [Streptomyces sp. SudanB5_2050]
MRELMELFPLVVSRDPSLKRVHVVSRAYRLLCRLQVRAAPGYASFLWYR